MGWVLVAGVALLAGLAVYQNLSRLRPATRANLLRWGLGGGAVVLTLALALFRRLDLAAFSGAAAFSIIRYGRLGPFTLGGDTASADNVSSVRSRYFAMQLDHDSGTVTGRVIVGQFAGADLIDLGEMETRALIEEVAGDPDSVSLLESWLDANRAGWREYFAETQAESAAEGEPRASQLDPDAEALAVLGLAPGASIEDIQAAHRRLMKNLHPDHGGSDYLAARINQARDHLLKARRAGR